MTVLEWLSGSNMYSSFKKEHYLKIAYDRGVDPDADAHDPSMVSEKQRDLMEADVIWMAVLKRPSNTAPLSKSHNGFQQTIGSEQDFYQNDKIKYAIDIYKRYGDSKGDYLESLESKKKIGFVPITDIY